VIALSSTTGAQWLDPNYEFIEAVACTGYGLADLWEASPLRLDSNQPKTDEIIDSLFPANPLLCCGWTRHRFDTRPRTRWYKLHDLQFIVPNPMRARRGLTQERKLSAHALGNTGERRFLIVEFDFDSSNSAEQARLLGRLATEGRDVRDLCAELLLHLAEKAPLTLAVYSGGKVSRHASRTWVRERGHPNGQRLAGTPVMPLFHFLWRHRRKMSSHRLCSLLIGLVRRCSRCVPNNSATLCAPECCDLGRNL
jgi:hypothetical protein